MDNGIRSDKLEALNQRLHELTRATPRGGVAPEPKEEVG